MSEYRHKSHNVSVLIYHVVCPAKYRQVVFDHTVDTILKDVCLEIAKRYEIAFLEIGTDKNHVHFLVQLQPPGLAAGMTISADVAASKPVVIGAIRRGTEYECVLTVRRRPRVKASTGGDEPGALGCVSVPCSQASHSGW